MQTPFTELVQHVLIPKESYDLILEYAQTHEDHRTYIPEAVFIDYNASFEVMKQFVEDALGSIKAKGFSDDTISIATQRFMCESPKLWPTQSIYHNKIIKFMEDAYRIPEKAQQFRDQLMIENSQYADAITYMTKSYLEKYMEHVMTDMECVESYVQGREYQVFTEALDVDFKGYYMAEDLGNQIASLPGMIIALIKRLLNGLSYTLSEAGKAFANRILANGQINEDVIKQLYQLYVAKNKSAAQPPIKYPDPKKVNDLRQAYAQGFDAFTKQMVDMVGSGDFKNVDVGVVKMIQNFQVVTTSLTLPRMASFQEFRTAILSIANNILLMDMFMKSLKTIDDAITSKYGATPEEVTKALATKSSNMGGQAGKDVNQAFAQTAKVRQMNSSVEFGWLTEATQAESIEAYNKKVEELKKANPQVDIEKELKTNPELANLYEASRKKDPEPKGQQIAKNLKNAAGNALVNATGNLDNLLAAGLEKILSMIIDSVASGLGSSILGMFSHNASVDFGEEMFEATAEQKAATIKALEQKVANNSASPEEKAQLEKMKASADLRANQSTFKADAQATRAAQPTATPAVAPQAHASEDPNDPPVSMPEALKDVPINDNGEVNANASKPDFLEKWMGKLPVVGQTLIKWIDTAQAQLSEVFRPIYEKLTGSGGSEEQGSTEQNPQPATQTPQPATQTPQATNASAEFDYDFSEYLVEAEPAQPAPKKMSGLKVAGTVVGALLGFKAIQGACKNAKGIIGGDKITIKAAVGIAIGILAANKILDKTGAKEAIKTAAGATKDAASKAVNAVKDGSTPKDPIARNFGANENLIGTMRRLAQDKTDWKTAINDPYMKKHFRTIAVVVTGVAAIVIIQRILFKDSNKSLQRSAAAFQNNSPVAPAARNIANTRSAVPPLMVQLWQNADQAVKNLWTYINGWLYGGQTIKDPTTGKSVKTVGLGRMIKDELTSLAPYVNMKNVINIDLPDDNQQRT